MPQGFTDLLDSERGVFALLVLVLVTVLLAIGKFDPEHWISAVSGVVFALIAGKTVTTAVSTMKGNSTVSAALTTPAGQT